MEENLLLSGLRQRVASFDQRGFEQTALPDWSRVDGVMEVLLEHPLIEQPLRRLRNELPQSLQYHNYQHTLDVLTRSVWLALNDGLEESDITLLGIAAAWHDTGFIEKMRQNEPIAACWAKEAMELRGGFSEAEVTDVVQAILDTQIQYDPETKTLYQQSNGRLSPWLLDADLSNFGGKDFFENSLKVYGEMAEKVVHGPEDMNDEAGKKYLAGTIRLLARHKWQSTAAFSALVPQEKINLSRLGLLMAEFYDGTEKGLKSAWDEMLSKE